MLKTQRAGNETEMPQRIKTEPAAPIAEIRITVVTCSLSVWAPKMMVPRTSVPLKSDTVSGPAIRESPSSLAYAKAGGEQKNLKETVQERKRTGKVKRRDKVA